MMNRERVENAFSKLSKICQTTDHIYDQIFISLPQNSSDRNFEIKMFEV